MTVLHLFNADPAIIFDYDHFGDSSFPKSSSASASNKILINIAPLPQLYRDEVYIQLLTQDLI